MSNKLLLEKLLAEIEPWDSMEVSDETMEMVVKFVEANEGKDLVEVVYNDVDAKIEPWRVGSLFDLLAWEAEDGGAALTKALEGWLESDDARKVAWALTPKGWFPYEKPEAMYKRCEAIAKKYPKLAETCKDMVARRQKFERIKNAK